MTVTNKATHEAYKTELFAPVIKSSTGSYIAVLSDTSVDRDEERVGKQALERIDTLGYTAGLLDHENKVLNQVCEWTNKRLQEIDGHTALVAEPKFFESNPNAKIIKGMLDEGAEIGISIGAIVKEYTDEKLNGKAMRTFTEIELLEASFVAIPSNRHGRIVAVAKSFKVKEEKQMSEKTYTQKDIDSAVSEKEKAFSADISDLNKKLESKNTEFSALSKKLEVAEKDALSANVAKLEAEKALETSKKASLEKQKFADQGGDSNEGALTEEDAQKAFSEGKLYVGKR